MSSYDATFKIALLGDSASKTTLVFRYLTGLFDQSIRMTTGVDYSVKALEIDGKKVKLQIWDFGGEERIRFLLPTYVRGADGALFIYDIANYTSIKNIDDWLSLIRKEDGAEIPTLLVGIISNEKNKRQVSVEDGKEIAKSKKLNGFIECNVRTGENVKEAFEALTRLMLDDSKPRKFLTALRLESMEVTDPLPEMRYPRNLERDKGDFKFLEEKLNAFGDLVEKMMSVILRIPDLVDQSLAPVNQKLSTLESRINFFLREIRVQKKNHNQLFKINPDGTTTNIELDGPIKDKLNSEECYIIVSDVYRKVYLWKGVNSNVRSKFIGAKMSQDIRGQVGMHFGVVSLDEGKEDSDFLKLIGGKMTKKKRDYYNEDDDDLSFPYPYIFKPPEPPDDFAMAPQVQIRAPLKEKDSRDEISCQYCGRELTKEDQLTHSCKKKP